MSTAEPNLYNDLAKATGVDRESVKKVLYAWMHMAETGNPPQVETPFVVLDLLGRIFHREHAVPKGFRNHEGDDSKPIHTEYLLFISEIIESFEDERTGLGGSEKIPGFSNTEEEMADLIIRVLESAAARGWRIGAAVEAKHKYNMTRPTKHGNKAF